MLLARGRLASKAYAKKIPLFNIMLRTLKNEKWPTDRQIIYSAREMRRLPTLNRESLRRSRMHVVLGVLRFSEGVVKSGLTRLRPVQSSSVVTSRFLLLCIQSKAASANLLNLTLLSQRLSCLLDSLPTILQ